MAESSDYSSRAYIQHNTYSNTFSWGIHTRMETPHKELANVVKGTPATKRV